MNLEAIPYTVSDQLYQQLGTNYNKEGKNSHIGNRAEAIVIEYFTHTYPEAIISKNKQGGDLDVHLNGETIQYEVKGTEENSIAFGKLRVSSKACHDALKAGMILIRVCNVGQKNVQLYFLKYGKNFDLKPECRWVVTPISKRHKL